MYEKGGDFVKKRIFTAFLTMLVVLAVATTAFAVQDRSASVNVDLTFSGTAATGSVSVDGNSSSDTISVYVELWRGNILIKSWTDSGTGSIDSSRTATVAHGKTYTLKAYATINGVSLPMASVTRTCP